ncbi:MFS transporter [Kibdelosporangium philippinense]
MTGIFTIVTTEILPICLLTSIAADFSITEGTAGLTMTMPGLLAAVSAPLVTVSTAAVDRRKMLCALVLLLTLANILAAAAPAYWVVVISRVLVGITIGGFWSIGAGLAARLVPPEAVPRATSVIFAAVPLGSVLGVPMGTFIGDFTGWRTAFVVMAVLSGGVFVALMVALPPLPPVDVTRLSVLRGALGSSRTALSVTFLVVLAHFGAYTYVRPFLEQVTQVDAGMITLLLLAYGAAGVIGNFAAGAMIAHRLRPTFTTSTAMIAGATILLPALGSWDIGAAALLMIWGVAYGAVPVCSQTWFAKSAPEAPEAASVLFTGSFQATIGIGALQIMKGQG